VTNKSRRVICKSCYSKLLIKYSVSKLLSPNAWLPVASVWARELYICVSQGDNIINSCSTSQGRPDLYYRRRGAPLQGGSHFDYPKTLQSTLLFIKLFCTYRTVFAKCSVSHCTEFNFGVRTGHGIEICNNLWDKQSQKSASCSKLSWGGET
jgi:hypothetical protein